MNIIFQIHYVTVLGLVLDFAYPETKFHNKIISMSKKNKPQEGKKLGNNFNLFLLTLNMITVHPTEKHM